jgi:LPS sulfotransferase NodH
MLLEVMYEEVMYEEVVYEEVVPDMGGATNAVPRFLGLELPAGHFVVAGTRRQTDEVNSEWARRHRSLRP